MVQLPGFTPDVVKRFLKGLGGQQEQRSALRQLRSMERKEAVSTLQKVIRGKNNVGEALDHLHSLPTFEIKEAVVRHEVEKASGVSRGKLHISLEFNREERKTSRRKKVGQGELSYTLVLLVGSFKQSMLLSESSLSISRNGTWVVSKELDFDWSAANADAGEGKGQIVLRLLWEEIRGLDAEMVIPIK